MNLKRHQLKLITNCSLTFLFLAFMLTPAAAESNNLGMLTLDQLLNVDVVSVAKVPEKIRNTPAAIQVISQEDLRRCGINSIPEALRLVPGMHVHRIDANKWAISARGFTSQFANKMLVMIDGRTVYSPLFSGVFWDVQDMMIADIDRIEVTRGPGGSLWGTNAVNGIINIISKESADTQGGLVNTQIGYENKNSLACRYGGWLDEHTSYRVYGKYFSQDEFEPMDFSAEHNISDIDNAADDYNAGRVGFRLDRIKNSNKMTLQGDMYSGSSGTTSARPRLIPASLYPHKEEYDVSGGNLLGRWEHIFSEDSDIRIQIYYDRTKRDDDYLSETRDTLDLDMQYRSLLWDHHEILWGLGYRYTQDNIDTYTPANGFYFTRFDPDSQSNNLITGFVQDRFRFANNRGELTLGTKVEYNEYTGMEWQPSIRLLWEINKRNSFWGAITRSIRTPSRLEHDADINTMPHIIPLPPPHPGMIVVPRLIANENIDSEKVLSYEIGFKSRPTDDTYFDITAFYNKYHDLAAGFTSGSPVPMTMSMPQYVVMPLTIDNNFDAETFGVEISSHWSIKKWWRLTTGFTWFDYNILHENGFSDPRPEFQENSECKFQASLVSYMDLPGNLELNTMFFFADKLETTKIDSYTRLDLNLVWHTTDNLTLTIGGRNLLEHSHVEYDGITAGIISSEIPRTFYGNLSWNF